MPLELDDLELTVDLPRLPRTVRILETESPTLDQRGRAIELFREALDLGDLKRVELPDSIAFVSERGEVEFFPASGALWARDAAAEEAHADELREWPYIEEVKQNDDVILRLAPDAVDELANQARELFSAGGLVSEHMKLNKVALEQVTHLSAEGEIISRGAGVAKVDFGYELDGFPIFGAGGKSQIFAEPIKAGSRIIGAFHCWRPAVADRKIQLQPVEKALAVGVLHDPELNLYHEKGGRIEINELSFGYMAFPAMVRQRYVFPVFQIEGRVYTPDDRQKYFEFARYHHAVLQEQYAEADIFADYLARMKD